MKAKQYPIYSITFWDHSSGPGSNLGPIKCEVVGYLVGKDKLSYYFVSWICDSEINNDNTDGYTILKSCVVSKKRLA